MASTRFHPRAPDGAGALTPTGFPIIAVLLDGLADWPCPELGGATPLEAADTPVLDALATAGANGLVYPLGPGRCPSSERAQWRYLGYDPAAFPGRAALEGLGAGLAVPEGTVAAYAALRSAGREGRHLRLRGSYRQADDDAVELLTAVDGQTFDGIRFALSPLERGDALLVLDGHVSHEITDTDPFSTAAPVLQAQPLEEAADARAAATTAGALNAWLRWSHRVLDAHPLNVRRHTAGRLPLNVIVTKWTGRRRAVTPLPLHAGGRTAIVAGQALYAGLAALVSADFHHLPDQDPEVELGTKTRLALDLVAAGYAFVYIHTKAPDEAGHTGDPRRKRDVIAGLDAGLVELTGPAAGEVVVAVTADHATPSWGPALHSGDAVPLAVCSPSARVDGVTRFGERAASGGALGTLEGADLLPLLVNLAGRGRFLGSRHARFPTIATDPTLPALELDDEPTAPAAAEVVRSR